LTLLLCGCASTRQGAAASGEAASGAGWTAYSQGFIEGYFRHNPSFAVGQGRHEYDGQLPDWSPTGLANRASFLRSSVAAAQAFDPAKLNDEQRFERDYLISRAKGDLFWIDAADQPHRNPAYYVGTLDPSVYERGLMRSPRCGCAPTSPISRPCRAPLHRFART